MQPLVKYLVNVIGILLLAGCAVSGPRSDAGGGDLLPMYGGIDRHADPMLRAADEKFISKAVKDYGDRRRASQSFVKRGIGGFLAGDDTTTMVSFNRAWLLDPGNPDPYWGFSMVYVDQGKHCDAKGMIDKALEKNLSKPSSIADAGHIYALCAVSDGALSAFERHRVFERSEELFSRAVSMAPGNQYIFGSWAKVHYLQGHYGDAWKMIKKQRALGGTPDENFLSSLRAKMPEPK